MHRSGDGDEPLNVKVTRRTPSVGFQVSYSGEHNGSWLDLTVVLQCHREREVRERERQSADRDQGGREGQNKAKQAFLSYLSDGSRGILNPQRLKRMVYGRRWVF